MRDNAGRRHLRCGPQLARRLGDPRQGTIGEEIRQPVAETYADRIVTVKDDGFASSSQIPTGTFAARGRATFAAAEPLEFSDNAETRLTVNVGAWSFAARLGDSPGYAPGKKSVRFAIAGGAVTFAWTMRSGSLSAFTWSVTAKTGTTPAGQELQTSPFAAGLGDGEPNLVIRTGDDVRALLSVEVENFGATWDFPLAGSVRNSVRTIGRGDDAQEFVLKSCNIRGSISAR